MLKDPISGLYIPPRFHIPGRRKFIEGEVDLRMSVSAKYKVKILHPRGTVTEPFGDEWLPNLITNYAFDNMMGTSTVSFTTVVTNYCRAGTSATAPANTDTALNAFWAATNTLTNSGAGSTNDTVNGAVTHTQSFDFAAAGGSVGLNELGLANTAANGVGLFTHALFPSQVNLNTGDVLRIPYSITFSIPATVTAISVSLAAVNGFNISGSMKVCSTFANLFGALNASGGTATSSTSQYLTVGSTSNGYICSAPTTFPTVNTGPSLTTIGISVAGSLGTYTNGSFTRNETYVWVPSNPASTVSNVNGIWTNCNSTITGLYLILTTAQTKANTNTLTVVTNATMARA